MLPPVGRSAATATSLCSDVAASAASAAASAAISAAVSAAASAAAVSASSAVVGTVASPSVRWLTLPGLFAAGLVDIMTTALLGAMAPPRPRARVLDFCSGSGVIAAALRASQPSLRLCLLDADALAVRAAHVNLSTGGAESAAESATAAAAAATAADDDDNDDAKAAHHDARVYLSDAWSALARRPRFDTIVSNPPVHLGVQCDFRILRTLIAGAHRRLRPGGELWLVAQTYVPVGRLLARTRLLDARAAYDDGRFTVWTATRAPKGRATKAPTAHAASSATACSATAATALEAVAAAERPAAMSGTKRPRSSERVEAEVTKPTQPVMRTFTRAPETALTVAAAAVAYVSTPRGEKRAAAATATASPSKGSATACDKHLSKAQRKRARRKAVV